MRICLSSIHPKPLSGQIEGLIGLAKELTALGHEVDLVTPFGSALVRAERLALAERDGKLLIGKLGRIGAVLWSLVGKARTSDIVHLNLPTPAFAFIGDIVQALVPVPVVVGFEAHLAEVGALARSGHLLDDPRFYLARILVNNRLTARASLHSARQYVVSSCHQAKELIGLGFPRDKIAVLPNVIDREKLRQSGREEARRQLGLPDAKLIGYIGHYHHVKGVEVLVEAFGHLARRGGDCSLVLAWSGLGKAARVERIIAEQRLADRVIRLGRLPIGSVISALDVLALPYRYTMGQNAYPGLVLEAMTLGVPLVTSDLPLLRELLEDEKTALLARPNDAQSLADRIERLCEDDHLSNSMPAMQRAIMGGRLAPQEVVKQYAQLYEQLQRGEAPILFGQSDQSNVRSSALRGSERRMGEQPGAEDSQVAATTTRESP